ncbi:hypothetical protein OsJ_06349 [Oryza sativa Japonica Group]|uniref:Uncharacterized protein n=1 Tax=Oryza sativa subsp. japonica TaxID=39947 RepID=B9F545_ORYSJ|nr:hypothetical protein OsJ_06349 [Oryza sativa Japonica Group]
MVTGLPIRVVSRHLVKASDATIQPHVLTLSHIDLHADDVQTTVTCVYPNPAPSGAGDFAAVVATFTANLPSFLSHLFFLTSRIPTNPASGPGRIMAEGDEWARHRCIIAPAFSATNLNDTIGVMEETTSKMLGEWSDMVALGHSCIDIEKGVVRNAAEIIAKANFSIAAADATVFHKAAGDAVPLHARVSSASRSPASSISAPPTRRGRWAARSTRSCSTLSTRGGGVKAAA